MADGRRAANLASEASACVQVEVGRRRRGPEDPAVGQLHARPHRRRRAHRSTSRAVRRGAWRDPVSPRPRGSVPGPPRSPRRRPGRGGARRASGRGARRGNRAVGRRRGRRNRSGVWGPPGGGPPSRGHRPWQRERRGRHRRRRRRGPGGCASPRRRPAPPDRPRSGPARRAAPAPTSGSPSRSAPAPALRSGSRPSPAPSRRAWCRSRARPARWRAAEGRRERHRHSSGSCTCRPASAWRWARPPCACVPLMVRPIPHDPQRAAPERRRTATRPRRFILPMVVSRERVVHQHPATRRPPGSAGPGR